MRQSNAFKQQTEELRQKQIISNQKIDFEKMMDLNKKVIKIQSFGRMVLTIKKLKKQRQTLRDKLKQTKYDKNKELFKQFVQILQNRKLTPEEFFRSIDLKKQNKIENESFIQQLIEKKVFANRQQAMQFSFLIDEDFSGDITLLELQKSMKAFQFETEPSNDYQLSLEYMAIIKVINILQQRQIAPNELFNSMDIDDNGVLSIEEITNFINSIVNSNHDEAQPKVLLNKEILIFMNFMDLDKNNIISRGEFLKQYTKLENLAKKNQQLYLKQLQLLNEQQNAQIQMESEQDTKQIVLRMQSEGLDFSQFISSLNQISEGGGMIKLGHLLRQFQMSYPTVEVDDFRRVLKWAKIDNGKFSILELHILLLRFSDDNLNTNSLFQTLLVIQNLLKKQSITPQQFISSYFDSNSIDFETFNSKLTTIFALPQESVIELFNSMLIDENQYDARTQDLLDVINSFYFDTEKISLNNINSYIQNYESSNMARKKIKIIQLVKQKLSEKKLQPMNIFKIAAENKGLATKESIIRAFTKLLPAFNNDVIEFIFNTQNTFDDKQFLAVIQVDEDHIPNQFSSLNESKQNYIKILDEALLKLNVSPSYLFKQADKNNNGKIDIMELKEIMSKLFTGLSDNTQNATPLDDATLKQIIIELDANGNGQLEEQEFFNLIRISRQINNEKQMINTPVDLINRQDLLPTKRNLLSIYLQRDKMKIESLDSKKDQGMATVLTKELTQIFAEIETVTSIKGTLTSIPIDNKMNIKLRDFSRELKKKGVKIETLVNLYRLIDTHYHSVYPIQQLTSLVNEYLLENKQPLTPNTEFNIICKIISMSKDTLNVEDYFSKVSDPKMLGNGQNILVKQVIDSEFQRLFKIQPIISSQIYEIIKSKYQFGLDKLLNKHLFLYIQQIYDSLNPQEKQYDQILTQKNQVIQQQMALQQSQQSHKQRPKTTQDKTNEQLTKLTDDSKQELLKGIILKLLGNEEGSITISQFLKRYGIPFEKSDFAYNDFFQIFVEQNNIINLMDAKQLYNYIMEVNGVNPQIRSKMSALDFLNFMVKIEQQISVKEVKEITLRLEKIKNNIEEVMVSNVAFVQSGMISKFSLAKSLIQAFRQNKDIQSFEIRFLLNHIDKDNNKIIDIDELQEYFKIYTSQKQISVALFCKYFAYKIDSEYKKARTVDVLKLDEKLKNASLQPQKAFAEFILTNFPHPKKLEYIYDLYDYISIKIGDANINNIMSYLYSQIDQHRYIPVAQKYITRNNTQLRDDLIKELLRQRPNYPIYKVMDDLQFADDGILPSLTLKHHIKKLYPYLDDQKINLFVTLVDINNDQKIEIQELFKFFNEIYSNEITYDQTLLKISSIVYSTNETLDTFFKVHQVDLQKIQQKLTFTQFVQAIAWLFKISKYESYIIFNKLKVNELNYVDFRAFLDSVNGQLKKLEQQNQEQENSNSKVEEKIKSFKANVASKISEKLRSIENSIEDQKSSEVSVTSIDRSKQKTIKLSNVEVLKIFIDNFQDLWNINIVKRACLKLQSLIKSSSRLRAQLFTRRACQVQEIYNELVKEDIDSGKEQAPLLLESEKVILCVLSMENVNKTYECNIYRFKQMIQKLNEKSMLDFQMLHKILEQRYKQLQELLFEDFLTIQTVIEKIRNQVEVLKLGSTELQFKEVTPYQEFLTILQNILQISFRPKEIILISRELRLSKDNNNLEFQTIKIFLAQGNVKSKLKEEITQIFDSLEQAMAGMMILREYLSQHPYLSLNEDLINKKQSIVWQSTLKTYKEIKICPIHQNQLIIDCMMQMNSDQVDPKDYLSKLIIYEDLNQDMPLIIVKINQQYVICDKKLPFIKQEQELIPAFSFHSSYLQLPYIEKALALYCKGYENLKLLGNLFQTLQLLSYSQIEKYTLTDKQETFSKSYQNLLDNFFMRNIMRHLFFVMPLKKKVNPLALGLEGGRVYSIIGLIQVKVDTKQLHNLAVIYNPYLNEDPRKSGEMWGKTYLNNTKKNKKNIDAIIQQYGQEVYNFIADATNNVYTYYFTDIFEQTTEDKDLNLYIYYNINKDQSIMKTRQTIAFDETNPSNVINIKTPELSQDLQQMKINSVFTFFQVEIDEFNDSVYQLIYMNKQKYKLTEIYSGNEVKDASKIPSGRIEQTFTIYYQKEVKLQIIVPLFKPYKKVIKQKRLDPQLQEQQSETQRQPSFKKGDSPNKSIEEQKTIEVKRSSVDQKIKIENVKTVKKEEEKQKITVKEDEEEYDEEYEDEIDEQIDEEEEKKKDEQMKSIQSQKTQQAHVDQKIVKQDLKDDTLQVQPTKKVIAQPEEIKSVKQQQTIPSKEEIKSVKEEIKKHVTIIDPKQKEEVKTLQTIKDTKEKEKIEEVKVKKDLGKGDATLGNNKQLTNIGKQDTLIAEKIAKDKSKLQKLDTSLTKDKSNQLQQEDQKVNISQEKPKKSL